MQIIVLLVYLVFPSLVLAQTDATAAATLSSVDIQRFIIAKDYFSTILASQTTIFSLIIATLLALNFLYQTHINKEEIKKEVEKQMQVIKTSLNEELLQNQNISIKEIKERLDHVDSEINILKGEVFRAMATFWDSQKLFSAAFIWWVRASYYGSLIGDETMTRNHLGSARRSVERISYWDLDPKYMSEVEDLLSKFGALYKIEVDTLYDAIKIAFTKKISK